VRRTGAAALLAARLPTTPWRALPDFVIIGAQKAGTTSLYEALVSHPDVQRAFRKEVHFFDTTRYPRVSWYRRHFPIDRSGMVTGESSPYYLFHPAVPARMRKVLPDVRLIVVLRDPVARAVSQYHHAKSWGFERRPIEIALDPTEQERLAPLDDDGWYDRADSPARERAYLARGQYAEQLERWFREFDRAQVLVLDSAALRDGTAIGDAQEHLGLRAHEIATIPNRNVGTYEQPDPALVIRLREHFAPHDERLAALLGRRPSWVERP
jgi:hypothetical protein